MATVVYSATALDHLERTCRERPAVAAAIQSAVTNLATHPLIGRRVAGELRELVMAHGPTGHVALYRFVIPQDEVRVLALRQPASFRT